MPLVHLFMGSQIYRYKNINVENRQLRCLRHGAWKTTFNYKNQMLLFSSLSHKNSNHLEYFNRQRNMDIFHVRPIQFHFLVIKWLQFFYYFFPLNFIKACAGKRKGKHGGPAHGTAATLLHSQATHPKIQKHSHFAFLIKKHYIISLFFPESKENI